MVEAFKRVGEFLQLPFCTLYSTDFEEQLFCLDQCFSWYPGHPFNEKIYSVTNWRSLIKMVMLWLFVCFPLSLAQNYDSIRDQSWPVVACFSFEVLRLRLFWFCDSRKRTTAVLVWDVTYGFIRLFQVSTHGYSQNQMLVWKYTSLTRVAKLTEHSYRVLYLVSVVICFSTIVFRVLRLTIQLNLLTKIFVNGRVP